MIKYVVTEWCGYFMVIEIDDSQDKIGAEIVYSVKADDSLADYEQYCEQWIKEMEVH